MVGGAVGLAVLAALATSDTDHQLHSTGAHVTTYLAHAALTNGFRLAFLIAAVFAAVGAAIAVFGLPGIPTRRSSERGRAAVETA
jgi:hypothetical protein